MSVSTFCAPAYHHVPEHVGTYGDEVADLAAGVGLHLDPEQRLVIDAMYAHDAKGRFVASELGGCGPRQNFKSHVGKAAALADLVLFEDPLGLWTAHLRATSDATFTELVEIFDGYDHLRRLLAGQPKDSDGEQSITLRRPRAGAPHPKLEFMARSERGGRGLSGNRVTFDEALFLKPSMTSAMVPILSARSLAGDVQVRYLGSPGLLASATWREIRDQGRAGASKKLAWIEWAAPHEPCDLKDCTHLPGVEGCALDRPHLIAAANLALGRRIDLDFVLGVERLRLQPPVEFMRERLGWWQDPPNSHGGDLDVLAWLDLADNTATPTRPFVIGVDQGEDRTVSIACAWRRRDQRVQVMLSQDERVDVALSPAAAVVRLEQLARRWGARVVLGGPSAGLEKDLHAVGVQCQVATSGEFATACGQLEDRIRAGSLRHGNQDELTAAVRIAKWRPVGTAGERAFKLKDAAGVGPVAALVRALHGLTAGRPPAAAPRAVAHAAHVDDSTSDLTTTGF